MKKMAGLYTPLCLLIVVSWTYIVDCAPPAELTLDVNLVSGFDAVEVYIGGMTKMEVKVAFPVGTTSAVSIELLPSTNVTIMALGEITVTDADTAYVTKTGSSAVVRHITDETLGQNVQLSTRAVIDLGDVTGINNGGNEADYTYIIQFESFVVSTDGLTDNETHWVSAGVEYDNSNSIWVGQIAHYIRTGTLDNGKSATFSMENVTEIKRMSLTPVAFEAWVPYPNSFIAVEAISLSTTNDHLRVVSLKCIVSGATTNYEFYDTTSTTTFLNYPLLQAYGADCTADPGGARRLRVELGNIPNRGSRLPAAAGEEDKIKFEAMVHMKSTAILSDEYPFGVGVEIDGSEVWVATMNVTAIQEDPIDFPLDSFTPVGGLTKSVGEGFLATASVTFEQRGLVSVIYKVQSSKNGGGTSGIMISQAYVESSGTNVECGSVTTTYASSEVDGIVDIAYVNITAANHGANSSDPNEDKININVAMVGGVGYAVDGGSYDVVISIYDPAGGHTQTLTYTMSGTVTYDTNTNHTFELTSDCGENQVITEGSTFDLLLTITTERGSNPESLQIEFPIPANVTDGTFAVCGIEVVKMGRNLVCFNPVQLVDSANKTTLSDGTYEYVAMNMQPACNMPIFDDEEEDKLVLRIKSRFKEGVNITRLEEYWFGIGSKYTSTQIWVAQYPLYGQPIYDFEGPAIITHVNILNNINDNSTFPGNYSISRSFDGTSFDTLPIEVNAPVDNGTHSIYTLQSPLMAKKAGLMTENCNSMCGVDYDFTYVSLKDYIDIFGDDSEQLINDMVNVFDNSSSTCMNLPVQGNTPPVFWARINTTILNIDLQSFTITVEGDGISCVRHGADKVLQVSISYPVTSSVGRFHGDVKFCKNTISTTGSPNTCTYTCMCPNTAECSEIIIFLANTNSGGLGPTWSLCGLTAENI
ncbi:unnamed protein product [Mytilus coruscus]|uniref:IgGFc-binding protein N-terminal domain-containing protein n=1 Tax=Mytilus coruscus TaxID=42192 RepID=A0A6J8DI55_MYTCO|nr:unnamed protein product [Mytilus coruscus]